MEELLPFLVLIGIVVMNVIGQKKRRDQQMGQKPGAPPRPAPGQRRPPMERPDQGRSGPPAGARAEAGEADESSEGMIPSDIWEEILGLARGQPPSGEPRRAPRPRPRATAETLPEGAETYEELQREETRPREIRLEDVRPRTTPPPPKPRALPESHGAKAALPATPAEGAGTRLRVSVGAPPAPEEAGPEQVRDGLFGDGSPEELRKAIILREVLGPPVGLRGD